MPLMQGYGLTETTSLISVNHPFRLGRGSIGKTLPGLEVKLSDEGEILVRGENVASGYWKERRSRVRARCGRMVPHGRSRRARRERELSISRAAEKNVIVTPEGLNIYPEDLEAELRKEAGVRDCVVVGLERDGNAEPCAVLLLREASAKLRHAEAIVSTRKRAAGAISANAAVDGLATTAISRARRRKSRCLDGFAKRRRRDWAAVPKSQLPPRRLRADLARFFSAFRIATCRQPTKRQNSTQLD